MDISWRTGLGTAWSPQAILPQPWECFNVLLTVLVDPARHATVTSPLCEQFLRGLASSVNPLRYTPPPLLKADLDIQGCRVEGPRESVCMCVASRLSKRASARARRSGNVAFDPTSGALCLCDEERA
ncbi:hypothetical protein CBL_01685 [Carabus blaptoides fortunei]